MGSHILHLACLLAICLPLLSVQLPSTTIFSKPARSKLCAETRSTRLSKLPALVQQRAQPERQQRQQETRSSGSSFGADGTTGENRRTEEIEGKGSTQQRQEEQSALKTTRKPWDPPFPKRENGAERKGAWRILPHSEPRRSERKGQSRTVAPQNLDGDVEEDELGEVKPQEHVAASNGTSQNHLQKARAKGISTLWLIVAGLAVLLLFLAFAILTAHCLAWFLVSNTEARLAEARRGLLKGGEMRLCLCSK